MDLLNNLPDTTIFKDIIEYLISEDDLQLISDMYNNVNINEYKDFCKLLRIVDKFDFVYCELCEEERFYISNKKNIKCSHEDMLCIQHLVPIWEFLEKGDVYCYYEEKIPTKIRTNYNSYDDDDDDLNWIESSRCNDTWYMFPSKIKKVIESYTLCEWKDLDIKFLGDEIEASKKFGWKKENKIRKRIYHFHCIYKDYNIYCIFNHEENLVNIYIHENLLFIYNNLKFGNFYDTFM